jgi:flagellar basal-body rod modification protein FlgD
MAALAGILHNGSKMAQSFTSNVPQTSAAPNAAASTNSSDASTASDSSSAAISANDFLTLLVTEMQNQDPTANTDPNEYINQLVQVNSLEQLIDINQNLSTALDTSSSPSGATGTPAPKAVPGATSLHSPPTSPRASGKEALAPGNLGLPASNPSANRVAHALNGAAQPGAAQKQRMKL